MIIFYNLAIKNNNKYYLLIYNIYKKLNII